jgi:hypothetical protein
VEGKRSRKPAKFDTYLATFAACINPTALEKLLNKALRTQLHCDQLLAKPKRWKELEKHLFRAEFKKASRKEIDGCTQRSCFGQASELINAKILPLM